MGDGTISGSAKEAIEALLADANDTPTFVLPTEAAVEWFLDGLATLGTSAVTGTTVSVLCDGTDFRTVMKDFTVSSKVANHIEAENVEFREFDRDDVDDGVAYVDSGRVASLILTGTGHGGFVCTTESTLVSAKHEQIRDVWTRSDEIPTRTPSWNRVAETMEESLGDETSERFQSAINAVETARGDNSGEDLGATAVALLVGAQREELFYDVSRWGEQTNIGSKAKFSRVKRTLEDIGLLETEKVDQPIGRPRQRLKVSGPLDEDMDPEELVSVVQTTLSQKAA